MDKFFENQGRRTYIHAKNSGFVEDFATENHLSFNGAVNKIIEAFSSQDIVTEPSKLLSEIQAIRKTLKDLHLIVPSSLLELLEVSGQLRTLTASSSKAASDGAKIRATFETFFSEMIALKEAQNER